MKVHSCYTTRDYAEVKFRRDVVVVLVSTETHQPCIHKYCDFHSCWTVVAWYLTDQVNSDRVLKKLATIRCVMWQAGWLLTNQGQLRCIYDLIIQWRSHRYHWWWQPVALWVTVLAIKAPVITRSCLLPTLIFPCFTFVATTNTLWIWHDEYNMSLWWCCVPIILFVDGHQNVRANFLVRQLQSCLSFSTRNKIDYELFVSI